MIRRTPFRGQSIALRNFEKNLKHFDRLIQIHGELGGKGLGRRYGLEVLNKSAVILLCACWEAYVEDLASASFDFMLKNFKKANEFPNRVLVKVSERLKKKKDKREIWRIADEGWKQELTNYKDEIIGNFHSPSFNKIDELYENLLDIKNISSKCYWPKRTIESTKSKIQKFVTIRNKLAHGPRLAKTIKKSYLTDHS